MNVVFVFDNSTTCFGDFFVRLAKIQRGNGASGLNAYFTRALSCRVIAVAIDVAVFGDGVGFVEAGVGVLIKSLNYFNLRLKIAI